jgi:hypothetical protein
VKKISTSLVESSAKNPRILYPFYLDSLLKIANKQIRARTTRRVDRINWARILISATGQASTILRDKELSELLQRVEALEASKHTA